MSAKGETSTKSFQDWAGGEQVTLAIVFTDVVGSTALGEEIRDEAMNEVRQVGNHGEAKHGLACPRKAAGQRNRSCTRSRLPRHH